jgi:hypothetical protein
MRDDHAAGDLGVRAVAALGVRGDLAEPAQELPAVRDLAARLDEGLAHLERHEQRHVFLALLQQKASGSWHPMFVRRVGRRQATDASREGPVCGL